MKNRLLERFINYVRCSSELYNEQQICLLLENELKCLNIPFSRQEIGTEIGSNGWNIFIKLPGSLPLKPLLFCLHMDTVSPGTNIQPVFENGIIKSSGNTVLGADGKAGIAVVMEAIECLMEQQMAHRPIEILLTICQEACSLGAKFAEYSNVESEQAILMDFSKLGGIVCENPYSYLMTFEISGRAAHAALEPEKGVHALKAAVRALDRIQDGRVDDDTTIMLGDFVSLSRANVIPQYARFDIEVRSFNKELLNRHIRQIIQTVKGACESMGAAYTVAEKQVAERVVIDPDLDLIHELSDALANVGIKSCLTPMFGICDSMYLSWHGIQAVNIGMGIKNMHSLAESISLIDMERMVRVVMDILSQQPK